MGQLATPLGRPLRPNALQRLWRCAPRPSPSSAAVPEAGREGPGDLHDATAATVAARGVSLPVQTFVAGDELPHTAAVYKIRILIYI
jgi:hypothetical protein